MDVQLNFRVQSVMAVQVMYLLIKTDQDRP